MHLRWLCAIYNVKGKIEKVKFAVSAVGLNPGNYVQKSQNGITVGKVFDSKMYESHLDVPWSRC